MLPTKDKLWDSWNNASVSKSCHAIVDDTGWWLTLPVNVRGWHVGSKGNGYAVGFEICEPAMMAYVEGSYNSRIDETKYSPNTPGAMEDFRKRYQNAVECAAYLCRETGLGAESVLCHQEAARKDMATNHADVLHWFPNFGKTMDMFRRDVAARLAGGVQEEPSPAPEKSPENGLPYVARVTATVLNVRRGPGTGYGIAAKVRKGEAYTIVEEKNGFGKLKSGAGWVSLAYMDKV